MGDIGRDITGIAMALIGVATLALLIGRSGDTAKVIKSATSGFNELLRTVSLQGSGAGVGGSSLSGYLPG